MLSGSHFNVTFKKRDSLGRAILWVIEEITMTHRFVGLIAFAVLAAGSAQAEIADQKVPANAAPEVVFKQIEQAAVKMCAEAARRDRVVNEAQCVNTLIAYTVAEADRPGLTAIALAERPAIATVRVQLPEASPTLQTTSLSQ
ncbi:MAG: hypothetical protein CFE32_02870 [Alphaproteobacteria bacterium PA3]|nr:MAG: hypothetical protein CFE32_02870 [Alphaproteobacteria bacterium PA3]